VVACGVLLVPNMVTGQDNLLMNPGFEDPLDQDTRWYAAGDPDTTLERSPTEARTGLWSGWIFNRHSQWHSIRYNLGIDGLLYDGGIFELSVWAKADNPSPQLLRLLLQINDDRVTCPDPLPPDFQWCFCSDWGGGDFSCLWALDAELSNPAGWIELSWTGAVDIMGRSTWMEFYVDTDEGQPLSDLYLDDASLIDTPDIFVDGFEVGDTSRWTSTWP